MENENNNLTENSALHKADVSSSVTTRDYFAAEVMKTFLANQGQYRKMTPLSRLKWWLGGNGWCNDWKAEYDYNMEQIAKQSFLCADMMMKAR